MDNSNLNFAPLAIGATILRLVMELFFRSLTWQHCGIDMERPEAIQSAES